MKMKRNKEIVLAAKAAEKSTGFGELVHSKESRGVNSAYGIGFLEGAVWSDEHPIHYDGQAKADVFIEKACVNLKKLMYDNLMFQGRLHREEVINSFVEEVINSFVEEVINSFVEDFKKTLEE